MNDDATRDDDSQTAPAADQPMAADTARSEAEGAPSVEPATARPMGRQARVLLGVLIAGALATLFWPRAEFRSAPDGPLETAEGVKTRLEASMAPVTLLHFWATWCIPCRVETPAIQRLGDDFSSADDGFSLVMVAVADDPAKVEAMIGARDATLYDPFWKVANRYNTRALPETHLVINGKIVETYVGATDWDAPEVRQAMETTITDARAQP
ncbi:MAG: TlpA disulfide reductase family protein [Acidobacteriota bacterium]